MEKPYIICVDDEKIVLDTLLTQLKSSLYGQFEFESAESGQEALELTQELIEAKLPVAVVISDQIMPGMQGDELLSRLHQLTPKSHKILLTGQASKEAICRAINEAQLYRYIAKPWEKDDLILTIQQASRSFLDNQQIEQQNRILEQLYNSSQIMAQELKTTDLLQKLMRMVMKITRSDRGSVVLYGGTALMQTYCFLYTRNSEVSYREDSYFCEDKETSIPLTYIEKVVTEAKLMLLQPVSKHPPDPHFIRYKTKSALILPMMNSDKMVGIFCLEIMERHYFTSEAIRFMQMFAPNAAISIQKALVYDNLELKVQERTFEVIEQKRQLEERNRDITDSLRYARRTQQAILPQTRILNDFFSESAVVYKPKDIVSGDFYWIKPTIDGIAIAAVDCTGHGVPGAMLAVLGSNLLTEITASMTDVKPSDVLNALHRRVVNQLQQSDHENKSQDGMDIAFCTFKPSSKDLTFAGAQRPLYVIRNGALIELKGDKMPIGTDSLHDNGHTSERQFTNQTQILQTGDIIAIFSDGILDQFGGDEGKKFTSRRFQDILLQHQHEPVSYIAKQVEQALKIWQGKLEQTDDILLILLRV